MKTTVSAISGNDLIHYGGGIGKPTLTGGKGGGGASFIG